MPMIDIQRRHAEVFRIRLGDKDGNRPRKLTKQIRITARNEQIVQAFVDVYGGEVTPWEGQHQAYLPTTELRILVLPGQSLQQWWERYRGSVCERRCDGYLEQKSGNRCMCPEDIYERAEDKDACSPMTRVNVLCPDVNVVGAGSLVTHSMIAAETLPQSISVAETALARGLMVPAVLRVVLNDKGRNHFIYPQIEIVGTSMNELAAGNGGAASLPHATKTPLEELEYAPKPALSPVPDTVPERPVASVAEQAAAVGQQRTARAGGAAPIPRTGLAPRTAAQAEAGAEPDRGEPEGAKAPDPLEAMTKAKLQLRCRDRGLQTTGNKTELIERLREDGYDGRDAAPEAPPPDEEPSRDPESRGPSDDQRAKFFATLSDLGVDDDRRKAWMKVTCGVDSFTKLSRRQVADLIDALEDRPGDTLLDVEGSWRRERMGAALRGMGATHEDYEAVYTKLRGLLGTQQPYEAGPRVWAGCDEETFLGLVERVETAAKEAQDVE